MDKNSFNFMTPSDLNDVYSAANTYYRSPELDRHLDNTQQVARAYVEAVLGIALKMGAIQLLIEGKEVATDHSSIEDE
jgi:hypothetical protein